MTKKLFMLTIGQAPRKDIAPIIDSNIGPESILVHSGALDGMSEREVVEKLFPINNSGDNSYVLTSRLTNGHSVTMLRSKLQPLLQEKIHEAENKGFRQIFLLCTGMFPGLQTSKANLLEPDVILPPIVKTIVGDKRLGVIVPLKDQLAMDSEKYESVGLHPIYDFASPYSDGDKRFEEVALKMSERVDYILMDCMGFNEHFRNIIRKNSKKPTILSNALIAKVLSEFI
ncbi:MAG: AroM family protein [Oenococcus oeni]